MNDDRARSFLVSKRVFGLDAEDIDTLYPWLAQRKCSPGETVFSEGAEGGSAYIVYSGRVQLVRFGWVVHVYEAGDIFGEVSLLDHKERTGTVTAVDDVSLFSLSDACLDDPDFPGRIAAKLYRAMGRKVSGYARAGTDFYRTMDVLLLQDGGCAPGYNTVTAFLSDYLEKDDRKVFIAKEGFKSLVTGNNFDFGALISSPKVFETFDHVPGVVFAPPLRDQRGAAFRTERYPEFKAESNQRKAAELIVSKRVRVIVGVGGDGTLAGLQALVPKIPREVQCFFVPVTIDSDIFGTECIGQHTGVEMGAEKVRGYLADSLTHHRCYIIEMMGANGGYHALNSCIGAGAHLAVLPGFKCSRVPKIEDQGE